MKRSVVAILIATTALVWMACGGSGSSASLDADAMEAAVGEAIALPSQLDRTERLVELFSSLSAENLAGALAAVEANRWMVDDTEFELFVEGWARFDPVAATTHDWNRRRTKTALGTAIRTWAMQDPKAAHAEVERLVAEDKRVKKLESGIRDDLIRGWVHSGQPGALEAVAARPPTYWPYAVPPLVSAVLRTGDVKGLLAWADEAFAKPIEDGLRDALLRRILRVATPRDPQAVSAWLLPDLGRPYAIAGPRILLNEWIQVDAPAAVAWTEQQVSAEEYPKLLFIAVEGWFRLDSAAAAAWVESLPAEARFDPAFHSYAAVASRRRGMAESAISHADKIQDDARRTQALTLVATRWYKRNPEAAEAWLLESELGEDARGAIRDGQAR